MKQIPRATAVTAQPCQLTSDRTTNHYTFQSFKGIRANLYIIFINITTTVSFFAEIEYSNVARGLQGAIKPI